MQGIILITSNQHGRQNRRNGIITNNDLKYIRILNKITSMINIYSIFILFIFSTINLSEARDFTGDVTPEDFVIDQLAALLQQHHIRQQQQQQQIQQLQEREVAEALHLSEQVTGGDGPGFSYHFPSVPGGGRESLNEPYFAINPSDPRFYRPSDTLDETNDDAFLAEPSWTGAGPFPQQHGLVDEREEIEGRALRVPNNPMGLVPNWPGSDEDESIETTKPPISRPKNMILHPNRPTQDPLPGLLNNIYQAEPRHHEVLPQPHGIVLTQPAPDDDPSDVYFAAIVAGCSAAGVVTVIATGLCWYKLQRNAKAAADVEYPAYGVTGPNKDPSPTSGDRRLAQSAQMYHYQHQKQQIIAMENRVANDRRGSMSEAESDEENEEGDYTVYECPGLAPTGEMEVKNPLFLDDPTPASPATPATPRSDEKSSDSGKKSPSTGSK